MDGGNTVSLNLESGLDVNTSDMLVSVNQNTWQHNWQKYQGKFLPNSVRFEKNGWAAGWNVFDFKYENLRVQLGEDLFANNAQLRDTPVYMVALFNAEMSADVLKSYLYTQESYIVSVSNDTAIFDPEHDNIIHSTFGAITCSITFDKDLKELTVDNDNVTMTYVIQDSLDYKIQLVNNTNSFNFDCDFKTGGMLQCEQFLYDLPYSGFENGEHSWNDEFTFDGTNINGTVPCTIFDNTVTFDYDASNNFDVDITLTLYDYIIEYTNLNLSGLVFNSTPLISSISIPDSNINRITCDFSATDIIPGDDTEVELDLCVPVWLTVNVNYDLNLSLGAREPNNTWMNDLIFVGESYSTKFRAKSIFENRERTGKLIELAQYDISMLDPTVQGVLNTNGPEAAAIKYRYNAIKLGNKIEWKNISKLAYTTVKNFPIWVGESEKYPSLNKYLHGQTITLTYSFGSSSFTQTYDYKGLVESLYNDYNIREKYITQLRQFNSWNTHNYESSNNTAGYVTRVAYWAGGLAVEGQSSSDYIEFVDDGQTIRQYAKYKNAGFICENPSSILTNNTIALHEAISYDPLTQSIVEYNPCAQRTDLSLISSIKAIEYTGDPLDLTFNFDGNSYGKSEQKYGLSLLYEYGSIGFYGIAASNRTINTYSVNDPYYGIEDVYYRPIIWEKSVNDPENSFPFEHKQSTYQLGFINTTIDGKQSYIYTDNGKFGYKLNTYKSVESCNVVGADFYPFEEAPQFNYYGPVGRSLLDSEQVEDRQVVQLPNSMSAQYEFRHIEGVYAVYIIRDYSISNDADRQYVYHIVTDFNEYKRMLLGNAEQISITVVDASRSADNPASRSVDVDPAYDPDSEFYAFEGTDGVHYPSQVDRTADRTRVVTIYSEIFYDYKRFNNDTTEEEKEAFRAIWNKWYPSIPNPQDNPPEIKFDESDNLYLNYNNIEIVDHPAINYDIYSQLDSEQQSEVQTYFKFTDPGVVLYYDSNTLSHISLSCFNELGIVPWKDYTTINNNNIVSFNDMTNINGKVNIWHNHILVNDLYTLTCALSNITIDIKAGNDIIQTCTLKYFKTINSDGTLSFNSTNFTTAKNNSDNTNFKYEITSIGDAGVNVVANDENCWLNNVCTVNDSISSSNFNGNIQSEVLYALGLIFISGQGVVISAALKGHIGYAIHYNRTVSAQELSRYNRHDTESIDYVGVFEQPPFNFYKLADDRLTENVIYIDRDTVPFSHNWFKLVISNFSPLEQLTSDIERYGQFKLSILPINNSVLYYSVLMLSGDLRYFPDIKLPDNTRLLMGFLSEVSGLQDEDLIDTGLYLNGLAHRLKVPVGLDLNINNTQEINDKNHIFYKEGLRTLRTAHGQGITTYAEMVANDNSLISIPAYFEDSTEPVFTLSYDTETSELSIPDTSFDLANATVNLSACLLDFEPTEDEQYYYDLTRQLTVGVVEHYTDIVGTFAKVLTPGYTLTGVNNAVYSIEYNGVTFDYDLRLNKLLDSDTIVDYRYRNNTYSISFIYGDTQVIVARFNYLDDNNLILYYHGDRYELDISQFTGNDVMSIESTDIRQCNKAKFLCDINATNEYQLVKQKWDSTVATENFWWVDSKHILELKDQEFILSRNTLELDDWNGNRWENIFSYIKSKLVSSDKVYYTVLNNYGSDEPALFLTIDQDPENNRLICNFYDIIHKFELVGTVYIVVRHVDLGHTLNNIQSSDNTVYFNTYSDIKYSQLLSQAKWSNTTRDGKIFIGCHMSNNFDQWTFIIDKNQMTVSSCIQGYGFVSIKGDLTGGQIPKEFFDKTTGFNDKVSDLNSLTKIDLSTDKTDIDSVYTVRTGHESSVNTVEARVVGTAERQWYICKTLTGVVSHLVYNVTSHDFDVQYIPITNNFDAVYKSPSFMSEVLFDNALISKALRDLCTLSSGSLGSIWSTFVSAAGNPSIYLYAPKFASVIYLQQTIGQYAYVHYNCSRSPERSDLENELDKQKTLEQETIDTLNQVKAKEVLLSDEFTFDKQVFNQKGVIPYSDIRQTFMFLFNVFLPSVRAAESKLSVNESVNTNTVDDVANVFSQAVAENLVSTVAKTLHTDSPATGLESSITGVRSLDMFYSTSENQRVFAGPGFVEHQFVADCVAQSFTDTQLTCYIEQLSFIIKILSTWRIKFANLATNIAIEALQKTADYTSTGMTGGSVSILGFGGSVSTNALGIAAGIVAWVAVKVAQLAARAAIIAQEAIEDMVNNLANQMKADTTDTAIRQSVEAEGKHKYGEKNEYFMWPCWGTPDDGLDYTDEKVVACTKRINWAINLTSSKVFDSSRTTKIVTDPKDFANRIEHSTIDYRDPVLTEFKGELPLYVASCYGEATQRKLPSNMAKIEGVTEFLPKQAFKNKNIGVSEPVFTPSLFQDYIIDKNWELSQCVTYGLTQWVTCKDTKLINCAPSNMFITNDFCGIAAPYTAVEVKHGLSKDYMRPWAVTPNVLAFNSTGYNTILDNKMYHAFDGISYRITDWTGSPGLNKNNQTFLYCFQVNDRFKRGNKFPANEVQGNFDSEPVVDVNTIDKVFTLVTNAAKEKGLEGGTIGEDKDTTRWALPIFTEPVNTLPTTVKTLTAMQLNVFDGITALTTNIMNNQVAYKAPVSVDFIIGKNTYRYTNDYICLVQTKEGIDVVSELVPALGLTYIGSSLTEAYFYSQATRHLYVFTGSALNKIDMLERFRDIKLGAWDFVNHEVVMPCMITFSRLDNKVKDTDSETDNIIIPVLSQDKVSGELPPPITTIFNDRSWYKVVSLPSGLAYQGPNRVIINRTVYTHYMQDSIKSNLGKWKKLNKEIYDTKRKYTDDYTMVNEQIEGINGWTYNPFVLVTSPLGVNENTECLFEWTITFCWPVEMDYIYGIDNYAVVNIMAETMTTGGRMEARPTHVFLTKELFTRSGNYGYYTFKYQSKNGMGNRERLHIWSDQYIAISSISLEYKVATERKTDILTQQIDVKKLKEL